jgi:hypothetical protein
MEVEVDPVNPIGDEDAYPEVAGGPWDRSILGEVRVHGRAKETASLLLCLTERPDTDLGRVREVAGQPLQLLVEGERFRIGIGFIEVRRFEAHGTRVEELCQPSSTERCAKWETRSSRLGTWDLRLATGFSFPVKSACAGW